MTPVKKEAPLARAPRRCWALPDLVRSGPAAGSSSALTRKTTPVKKEAPGLLPRGHLVLRRPKEEVVHPPAAVKKWWEMELEARAAYHSPMTRWTRCASLKKSSKLKMLKIKEAQNEKVPNCKKYKK
jgi:hypothetical protein